MKFRLSPSKSLAFIKFFRFILLLIALGSIFFGVINTWQETHQIEPLIEKAGGKIFNPLYNLLEHLKSVSADGLWQNTGHLFKDIGSFFKNIYFLIEPLILLYYGFYYLFLFCEKVIIGDDSRKMQTLIATLFFYFFITSLYIGLFAKLPLLTPFNCFKEIFNYLKILF